VVRRTLALFGVLAAVLMLGSTASAAIFMRIANVHVQRGGIVRFYGNPRHMPFYALPARKMPCIRSRTCAGFIHRAAVPQGPFVLLGHAPGAVSKVDRAPRAFTIRLPRALTAGKYVVFVWCAACGGSLISAGTNPSGQPQILDVRAT
jgi:ABC-type Fe3+-siderophore transport system permease subunit